MRILLVDDERDEREGISFLIRKFQYPLEIRQASSGKEALEIIKKESIDILFTDVKMPVMSGLELARAVREYDKTIKIIIFSAYAEFEYAKQAIEMNALRYLLKPIEIDEFKSLMSDVIQSLMEMQKTDEKNRRDLLFKVFTGAKLEKDSEEIINHSLFYNGNKGYRYLNIELSDNYFEDSEDNFIKTMKSLLGEKNEYIALYPNESCVLLENLENNKSKFLVEKVHKLLEKICENTKSEGIVFVSPIFYTLNELEMIAKEVEHRKDIVFGYGNRIIEMDKTIEKTEHYVSDIECIWNQLLESLDSKNPEIIYRLNEQLMDAVLSASKVSKLYIQNILYTVIKSMYDKLSGSETEEVLIAAESLFRARDAKTMIEEYNKIIEKMLISMRRDSNDTDLILHIKGYIEQQYMRDIGLNDIAEEIHMAPAYVSYIFKQETGQSLIKYVTDVKMAKARKFLEDKEMKIIQIGRACGYENQSYFNRLFKNYYGITPKQYREQL